MELLKSSLPSYFAPLFSFGVNEQTVWVFLAILFFTFIFFSFLYGIILYFRFKKSLLQKSTILEIRPPSISLQSAFSTKQLFTILHSLTHDLSLGEKLLKVKKRMSYEIVSTREEGIRYLLYLPQEDVPIVTKNIRAYVPEVVISEINDYIPQKLEGLQKKQYSLTELKLSYPYVFSLQEQDILTQYDPIAYLTAHMTKLDPDEVIAFQIITTPVTASSHGAITEKIYCLNKRIQEGKDIKAEIRKKTSQNIVSTLISFTFNALFDLAKTLVNWIMDFATATRRPYYQPVHITYEPVKNEEDLTANEKETQEQVEKKINQSLFEVTLRLFITGSSKEHIELRKKGIVASLATFKNATYQELRAKQNLLLSFTFFENFNYLKLKNRLLSYVDNPILSISEISSIYHFPFTKTTQTEDLQSTKSSELPAPINFKKSNTDFDIIFASNIHGELKTPIGLTLEERRRHTYIIGATGTGKSTLLLHMIHQDIRNRRGIAVIDPHGDLTDSILGIISEERVQDVVYFNPYDIEHPIAINLLELPNNLSDVDRQREKDLIVSSIISIFHKLYPEKHFGPRMEHVLRNTILTALELENPTFMTIYKLLTEKAFRQEARKHLKKKLLVNFWKEEFEKLSPGQRAEVIAPITNKLGRFLTTSLTRNIVDQNKSTVNFEEIINSGKILICNLSVGKIGEDVSAFLGILIIAKLQLAALRRVHIPENQRSDFFLYIDEFQNFATQSFAQILSEARKYRLGAILVHQNVTQIKDAGLLDTIIANSGTTIAFRTKSPNDEETLLPVFAPEVQKGQMGNLPSYRFYIKINALEPQNTFTGQIEKFAVMPDRKIQEKVIAFSQIIYSTTPKKEEAKEVKGAADKSEKIKETRPSV